MRYFIKSFNNSQFVVLSAILLTISSKIYSADLIQLSVIDGDTLHAFYSSGKNEIIRLSDIDAPETMQAAGYRSARNLYMLIHEDVKLIKIKMNYIDAFNRKNATVFVRDVNINQQQVTDGYAWVSNRKAPANYMQSEKNAKKYGKGLWSDKRPLAPWVFRKGNYFELSTEN